MTNKKKDKEFYYKGEQKFAPVPLHVGSALIRPEDKGKIKTTAVDTMERQARQQIEMLRRQADAIMEEVRQIEERIAVSYDIYQAEIKFTPQIGEIYYLYLKKDTSKLLSMISPKEWSQKLPYEKHISSVRLLADKTWEIIQE
jgi:hypothetical protein